VLVLTLNLPDPLQQLALLPQLLRQQVTIRPDADSLHFWMGNSQVKESLYHDQSEKTTKLCAPVRLPPSFVDLLDAVVGRPGFAR
jgi:hypothetical protein